MAGAPLILIVDDEAAFREVLSVKLSSVGFRVDTAENANDGIKKAKELKPDLILMDMKMPGPSGADAVISLHEDQKTKDIKIVFLSAFGDPRNEMEETDKNFARQIGAIDYIRKTDDLSSIAEKVRHLVLGK